MISNMFREINQLDRGLDAAWLRNEVISQNIANVDTPGYNRKAVAFEDYYQTALNRESQFALRQTRARHIDKGAEESLAPRVYEEESNYRMDGNNVDIDKEMTDLAVNVIYYQTMLTKVTGEMNQLDTAIKGGM